MVMFALPPLALALPPLGLAPPALAGALPPELVAGLPASVAGDTGSSVRLQAQLSKQHGKSSTAARPGNPKLEWERQERGRAPAKRDSAMTEVYAAGPAFSEPNRK
jgi:hypothetical protein